MGFLKEIFGTTYCPPPTYSPPPLAPQLIPDLIVPGGTISGGGLQQGAPHARGNVWGAGLFAEQYSIEVEMHAKHIAKSQLVQSVKKTKKKQCIFVCRIATTR